MKDRLCRKCKKRLEEYGFPITTAYYCVNEKCPLFGILVVAGIETK